MTRTKDLQELVASLEKRVILSDQLTAIIRTFAKEVDRLDARIDALAKLNIHEGKK